MKPWFKYPRFSWQDQHAVVIGAGIAGCQMTWHLSQLGWQVSLLEKDSGISRQVSGNLTGVISPKMTAVPSLSEQFHWDAFEYTTRQLKSLKSNNTALDWYEVGVLDLAYNAREKQRWESLKQRHLDSDFIQLIEAENAAKVAGIDCSYAASYFPKAGYINPASFCQALLAASNYQLLKNTEVAHLKQCTDEKAWEVFGVDGELITRAPVVILCNGQSLSELSQFAPLPHAGVLGQTSHSTSNAETSLNCVINHEGYLTPEYQGVNVFGATFERQFEDVALSDESDQKNLSQLQKCLPNWVDSMHSFSSGHAALRTVTPDRYPYAGALPDFDYFTKTYQDLKHGRQQQQFLDPHYQTGLFLLGALGSRGLTTSGYCANALSQLIDDSQDQQQELLEMLHPARFLVKQLKRGKT